MLFLIMNGVFNSQSVDITIERGETLAEHDGEICAVGADAPCKIFALEA